MFYLICYDIVSDRLCHCCADRITKRQTVEFAVLSHAADRIAKKQAEQDARKAERQAWQDALMNDEID